MVSNSLPCTFTPYFLSISRSYFRFCPIFSISGFSNTGLNSSTTAWASVRSAGTGT